MIRHSPLLCLLCWTIVHLPALEIQRLQPLHSPRPGDEVEFAISADQQTWLSPMVSATPFMVFTESDGQQWQRSAFTYQAFRTDSRQVQGEYAQSSEVNLRIRHSPRRAGDMAWALYAPGANPESDAPLAQGRITVLPGTGDAGPIGQAPFNHRLLAHPDGKAFIPIGPNIAWALGSDRLATFVTYLDRLQAVGGNHIRVWCASWFAQIEGDTPATWRLDQAWLLDQIFREAGRRNIYITLVLDNHHDFKEGNNVPYGETLNERQQQFFNQQLPIAYRQRLSYLVARYGHHDNLLAWELFNEIDLTEVERWRLLNWARAASDYLSGLDPYNRLLTISWAGADWPEMRSLPRITLHQIHRYVPHLEHLQASDADIIATLVADAVPLIEGDRPFLFAEVGHHGDNAEATPGNDLDRQGLILVHKAWAGFLLGGAGPGMSWWWDSWIDQHDLWHLYQPLADTIEALDWNDPQLKPLAVPLDADLRVIGWQAPNQALIWPQSVHDNWHNQLVSQSPNPMLGRRFQVTLSRFTPQLKLAITAIDMTTGATTHQTMATTNDQGQLVIRLPPHNGQQVLIIKPLQP